MTTEATRPATPQEQFWAGEFGDHYANRNLGPEIIAKKIALFTEVLRRAEPVASAIEYGASVGLNLKVLRLLLPTARLAAVEINARAYEELCKIESLSARLGSLLDDVADEPADFVLSNGLLIHIPPDRLDEAYARLHAASRKYVCLVEYYNPTPVEVPYRGHSGMLFKRDFAGDMLDRFPDLVLRDYGFCYHRDHLFPGGDATWFLLERRAHGAASA